jgi:hypothetical protein
VSTGRAVVLFAQCKGFGMLEEELEEELEGGEEQKWDCTSELDL